MLRGATPSPQASETALAPDQPAAGTPEQRFFDASALQFEPEVHAGRRERLAALLREREAGIAFSLACMVVDEDGADVHGFEPVYHEGEAIAYVASGGYGHTVAKSIAFAYLPAKYAAPGTELQIGILGDRRPAVVVDGPLYDPKSEKPLS